MFERMIVQHGNHIIRQVLERERRGRHAALAVASKLRREDAKLIVERFEHASPVTVVTARAVEEDHVGLVQAIVQQAHGTPGELTWCEVEWCHDMAPVVGNPHLAVGAAA